MKYPLQVGDQIYFTKVEVDDEAYCEINLGKLYLIEKGPIQGGLFFTDEEDDLRTWPLNEGYHLGIYDYELVEEENE